MSTFLVFMAGITEQCEGLDETEFPLQIRIQIRPRYKRKRVRVCFDTQVLHVEGFGATLPRALRDFASVLEFKNLWCKP